MVLTRATNRRARRRRHPRQRPTTSTSTPTPPRRSSTRTRPIPRIPRTRCSCAPTRCATAGRWRPASLLTNRDVGADGIFGTTDDVESAAWRPGPWSRPRRATARHRAERSDVHNVPLLATDPYGNFIPGPNGFPQVVTVRPRRHSRYRRRRPGGRQPAAPISPIAGRRRAHRPRFPGRHRAFRQSVLPPSGIPLTADADDLIGDDHEPRRPTTTSCSTRTSWPATAASTRTSA